MFLDRVRAAAPDWSDSAKSGGPATFKDLEVIFARIVSVIASLAGIAALAMLIVGGFRYLSSGGDPKAAAAARNTMTYAFIGILLLIGTWLILKILENITGVTLTKFIIYTE
jgi:hypothetical protein